MSQRKHAIQYTINKYINSALTQQHTILHFVYEYELIFFLLYHLILWIRIDSVQYPFTSRLKLTLNCCTSFSVHKCSLHLALTVFLSAVVVVLAKPAWPLDPTDTCIFTCDYCYKVTTIKIYTF